MATLLHNAGVTRHWPDGEEKRQEAERQVHHTMYEAALGCITEQEREQILEILRPSCPELFTPLPPSEEDWRLAVDQDMILNLAYDPGNDAFGVPRRTRLLR